MTRGDAVSWARFSESGVSRQMDRAEVGLPRIGDKVSGLRRKEVAYLAGVSVTWYTWLEQGRAVKPSRHVLNALAESLRLSGDERSYLLSLAGYSALEPAADPVLRKVPDHVQRFLDSLDFPAYAIAADWGILTWNAAFVGLYPGISAAPEPDRNLLWLLFTDPSLREMLPDWERTARAHVAAFRVQAGPRLADARFSTLVDRLLRVSETFRAAWESHTIERLSFRERVLRHPVVGDLHLTVGAPLTCPLSSKPAPPTPRTPAPWSGMSWPRAGLAEVTTPGVRPLLWPARDDTVQQLGIRRSKERSR